MNPNGMPYRYEFSRTLKEGVPCLKVEDNYLAPLVKNTYLFKYEDSGIKELDGYGALMIDKILEMLDTEHPVRSKNVNHIVVTESMSRIKKALEELAAAMEEYDDRTGSKSEFSFISYAKKGEVFTTKTKNSLI